MHQNGLDIDEKILRHFDLSSQYGVSNSASLLLITCSDMKNT